MEEQFDAQQMLARAGAVAREIRRSDAFPALIGGIAGGIAGALMATIIAGRVASRNEASSASAAKKSGGGWSMRDLAQLLAVVVPLAKQMQALFRGQKK